MFSKVFLYEVIFFFKKKKKPALDVFLSTLFFYFLLSFLFYHSTMQCNFVSNGRCCGVTRSCINIIFLTSGMHLQHYCVRRLWCWNSGNVLISCECINTNLFKYDTLPLSILKLSLHLVCRLGLGFNEWEEYRQSTKIRLKIVFLKYFYFTWSQMSVKLVTNFETYTSLCVTISF